MKFFKVFFVFRKRLFLQGGFTTKGGDTRQRHRVEIYTTQNSLIKLCVTCLIYKVYYCELAIYQGATFHFRSMPYATGLYLWKWLRRRDSNSRPSGYEPANLTADLLRDVSQALYASNACVGSVVSPNRNEHLKGVNLLISCFYHYYRSLTVFCD